MNTNASTDRKETPIPGEIAHLSELLEVARDGYLIPWSGKSVRDILHSKSECGDTLLHVAAARGSLDEVYFLLKNGLEINAVGDYCATPLHCAALCGHEDAFNVLIENGANPCMRLNTGATARELFERNKKGAEETIPEGS